MYGILFKNRGRWQIKQIGKEGIEKNKSNKKLNKIKNMSPYFKGKEEDQEVFDSQYGVVLLSCDEINL